MATNNQEIETRLASLEALAFGIIHECQQTRKLLEKEAVSTAANEDRISKIAQEARDRLRKRIYKG